ncbi:hypothetical protein SERLADRAFT_407050 [Serpula lacrymans var. lacrymans S7.9]|uniref:Uncharacterized protein n=1 Tax=Serpula lacrymans var. lacrymans (strain S7.9) TaxID=578457 RepID=F8NQT6_SERL9|nr:uncharacterized protein SERLADRAFT_407050 [Serpula lacrymans var. lacrymans S7.9]EGO26162.1 hypothetical protein SERLADRAFT_407050 [Serpula lacrymans var. lacrymans S7.9]
MAHTSPAAMLVWAVFSLLLGVFLLFHLWSFDRFKCLKWNTGPYSGAFKRVMTYSYLCSVPLITVYSVGFAIIKYHYGFTYLPVQGVIPVPYEMWSHTARSAILPLYLCFSVGWSLEMVTHLEELCFWLFLVNAGSAQQDWFRSAYFRTWTFGSFVAVIYMPLVTIFTRQDPYKCEAYTFLAGSLGSLSLTIWFLPILWTFPVFLRSLRNEHVDINTIVRLTKFHELNCIRVVFRFLFTVPFVILGIDGVRPHQHINDKMFPVDLLAMIAAVGCTVSSGITLVIFFPRSIETEIAARDASRIRRPDASHSTPTLRRTALDSSHVHSQYSQYPYACQCQEEGQGGGGGEGKKAGNGVGAVSGVGGGGQLKGIDEDDKYDEGDGFGYDGLGYDGPPLPLSTYKSPRLPPGDTPTPNFGVNGAGMGWAKEIDPDDKIRPPSVMMQPNRRTKNGDVELGGLSMLTEGNLTRHNASTMNRLVHQFTSPINFGGGGCSDVRRGPCLIGDSAPRAR